MRKVIALLTTVFLLLSLSACTITIGPLPNATTTSSSEETTSTSTTTSTQKTTVKKTTAKKTTKKTTTTTKKITTTKKPTTTTTKTPTTTTQKPTTTTTKIPTTTAHVHDYKTSVVAPTCTEQGYTNYTCSCGHSYKDNYVQPRHTFVDHICSSCKVGEYEGAYDKLATWLLENGTTHAEYIAIGSPYNGNVRISYYPNQDQFSFTSWYSYNGESILLMLFLHRDGSCSYYNGIDDAKINGLIDTDAHTHNYPLSYDECEVAYPYSHTYEFLEDTRQHINIMLDACKVSLSENNIGLTLADLGFVSF